MIAVWRPFYTEYTNLHVVMPGILRFAADKFMCLNSATKKPEKDCTFIYENIDSIAIRARHLHLDVRYVKEAL